MKNHYGICEWYLPMNGLGGIKSAALMGYEGIQLTDLGGANSNFPLTDPRIQEQYLELAERHNMVFHGFQANAMTKQGGIKYPVDSPEGELTILSFKKGLEACEALGVHSFLVASFDASRYKNDYEMKNTAVMLKLFVRLAREKGIQVAFESFQTTDKLLWVMDYVGDGLKLCYDTLNPIRFGVANPPDEIRQLGVDIIDHVHVKDSPENLIGSCPLGQGAGKFNETISVLKELGYQGWYVAENYFYLPPMSQMGNSWDLAVQDLNYLHRVCE